jgi:putative membrane protein
MTSEKAKKAAKLPLADSLAHEQTNMANERTLLAYIRTSLAMLVVAVTMLKFFASSGMHALAYGLLAGGVAVLAIGGMNFVEMRLRIGRHVSNELELMNRAKLGDQPDDSL